MTQCSLESKEYKVPKRNTVKVYRRKGRKAPRILKSFNLKVFGVMGSKCVWLGKFFQTFWRKIRIYLEGLKIFFWHNSPQRATASSFTRFLDHTQRRTTFGGTPLDEWWARHRDLYLRRHNIHNRQISMTPVGFEPTVSAGERPQTYALVLAAAETCSQYLWSLRILRRRQNICRNVDWHLAGNTVAYCSCSPPNLNLLVTNFMFCINVT